MPTKIEWSGESWNPIRAVRPELGMVGWHCEHASPGCQNCYAETQNVAQRFDLGTGLAYKPGHRKDVEIYVDPDALVKPLGWKKGRKVFVCSMTDLFADFVTDEMIDRIFAVMALCPQHTFQVLTKRSARMREYLSDPRTPERIADIILGCQPHHWGVSGDQRLAALGNRASEDQPSFVPLPLPNVWLGVSVEDQQRADERIPDLLATPAALRWISAEPLLGPVDLETYWLAQPTECERCDADSLTGGRSLQWCPIGACPDDGVQPRLDWVVVGGESGAKARGSTAEVEQWMRSLRDQCAAAGVPFFGKQNYRKLPLPEDLMVREYPHG